MEATVRTTRRVVNTTEKSTSLKKSINKKIDIPKIVMKVTSLREVKLEGCINCSYFASCTLSNFQM
jgi:heterodisulfide reductase subunit C